MIYESKKFNCVRCGECCRHIDLVEGLKHLQVNGICKYLIENQCLIYEERPDLCRYDSLYEILKKQALISLEEYDKLSVMYCEMLQDLKRKANNETK